MGYTLNKKFNLFSVTNILINGWYIGGDGKEICQRKNEQTIKFDINIKTKEGIIFSVYVNRELTTQ